MAKAKQQTGLIGRLREFLAGKKTFIAAGVMVVLSGLRAQGFISDATFEMALATAGALGLVALRVSVPKK